MDSIGPRAALNFFSPSVQESDFSSDGKNFWDNNECKRQLHGVPQTILKGMLSVLAQSPSGNLLIYCNITESFPIQLLAIILRNAFGLSCGIIECTPDTIPEDFCVAREALQARPAVRRLSLTSPSMFGRPDGTITSLGQNDLTDNTSAITSAYLSRSLKYFHKAR